jgi:cyclopropane fatty-acyl-phospholipid synthase-like methyltransferase
MFRVITDFPVALDSLDHILPIGTIRDNSKNYKFNEYIYSFNIPIDNRPIHFLDIGCAGGGLVEDFVNDGHLAIGLEGSNISLILKRAAWASIPNNLFTCDVTKEYSITYNGEPFFADVITAWEVMEHFKLEDIDSVLNNINKHLVDGGYFFGSISYLEADHHKTCRSLDWWKNKFAQHGMIYNEKEIDSLTKRNGWVRIDDLSYLVCFRKG